MPAEASPRSPRPWRASDRELRGRRGSLRRIGIGILQLEPCVDDVMRPLARILASARSNTRRIAGRRGRRQRRQSGSPVEDRGNRVRRRLARRRRTAGEHLEEDAAERPDVRPRVDRVGRAPARGSCRRRCRGSRPPRVHAGRRSSGIADSPAIASRPGPSLARPKSSTLTVPSGRDLDVGRFRSRWTMPFSCAASRARQSGRRSTAPRRWERALREAIGQRRPFTSSSTSARPSLLRARRWRRCSDGSATASSCASRSKRASRSRIAARTSRAGP